LFFFSEKKGRSQLTSSTLSHLVNDAETCLNQSNQALCSCACGSCPTSTCQESSSSSPAPPSSPLPEGSRIIPRAARAPRLAIPHTNRDHHPKHVLHVQHVDFSTPGVWAEGASTVYSARSVDDRWVSSAARMQVAFQGMHLCFRAIGQGHLPDRMYS